MVPWMPIVVFFHLCTFNIFGLSDNDFNHSQIPSRIGEFSQLRYLNLAQPGENTFFGEVPPQVSHLRNLLILDLRSYFEYIPPNPIKLQLKISTLRSLIQNATSLEVLRHSFVTISSSIPDMLTNLTSLRKLELFHCVLYGEFPIERFFKLKMLNNLGLSGNKLSLFPGISSSNETFPPIQNLGLRSCNLHGEIPSWIMNLTDLAYLDLEYNNLQG
ncbi:receptor-like protein 46 [Arachis stenosperma]|uniref:receptor-like protein 46 n=1 Tax=Arachis stenosperma TaxID=217475 RepID=UPI0025ABB680|nr:receptor-like protein 46 [Arachis stenosperma]